MNSRHLGLLRGYRPVKLAAIPVCTWVLAVACSMEPLDSKEPDLGPAGGATTTTTEQAGGTGGMWPAGADGGAGGATGGAGGAGGATGGAGGATGGAGGS
jgi:hypothetical protein